MNRYENHCLICLEKLKSGQSILLDNRSFAVNKTFRECYEIVVSASTLAEGPQKICNVCSKDLVKTYQFIDKTLNSRKVLEVTFGYTTTGKNPLIDVDYIQKRKQVVGLRTPKVLKNDSNKTQGYINFQEDLFAQPKHQLMRKIKTENEYDDYVHSEPQFTIEAVAAIGNECEVETSQDQYSQVIDYDLKEDTEWSVEALDENFLTHVSDGQVVTDGNSEFNCKSCSFRSELPRPYLTHVETVHFSDPLLECCLCLAAFNNFRSFKSHFGRCPKRMRTYSGVWECPVCHDVVYNLHGHIEVEHQTMQLYECDQCGKKIGTYRRMHLHMIHVHLGVNRCRKCNINFPRLYDLTKHNNTVHPKTYNCNVCSFTTQRRVNYNYHMKRHLGTKDVVCEKCSKAFVLKRDLYKHMQTHGEENRFQCDQCPKTFKTRHILNKHKAYHRDPQYECPVCQKQYRQLPTMRQHVQKEHPFYKLPPKGTVMAKIYLENASRNDTLKPLYTGRVGENMTKEED